MQSTRLDFLLAVALNDYKKVKELLSKPLDKGGADVNWAEETNEISGLIHAINNNNYDMVELLLVNKANPNAPTYPYRILKDKDPVKADQVGSYPLHEAVKNADMSIITLLLNYGANPNLSNEVGKKPSDLIKENRCFDKKNAAKIFSLLTRQQNDQIIISEHSKRKVEDEENIAPTSKKIKFTLFHDSEESEEKEEDEEKDRSQVNKKEF